MKKIVLNPEQFRGNYIGRMEVESASELNDPVTYFGAFVLAVTKEQVQALLSGDVLQGEVDREYSIYVTLKDTVLLGDERRNDCGGNRCDGCKHYNECNAKDQVLGWDYPDTSDMCACCTEKLISRP